MEEDSCLGALRNFEEGLSQKSKICLLLPRLLLKISVMRLPEDIFVFRVFDVLIVNMVTR